MLGIYVAEALLYLLILVYFLAPLAAAVWLIISLVRWIRARRAVRPERKALDEIKVADRKKQLIVAAVTTVIIWACVIGLAVLFVQALSFM